MSLAQEIFFQILSFGRPGDLVVTSHSAAGGVDDAQGVEQGTVNKWSFAVTMKQWPFASKDRAMRISCNRIVHAVRNCYFVIFGHQLSHLWARS